MGKTWEPREKSQRVLGSEREAGWEARMGMSKKVSANIPPEPIRLVQAERMRVVLMASEDMVLELCELCLSVFLSMYDGRLCVATPGDCASTYAVFYG